jgi:hypothetical protein
VNISREICPHIGAKSAFTLYYSKMVICHMAQSETTREAIPFDFPGLDSSGVEHLAYIQEAWVQSLVWPDLGVSISNPSNSMTNILFHQFLEEHTKFPFPNPFTDGTTASTDISLVKVGQLHNQWKALHTMCDNTLPEKAFYDTCATEV